MPSLASRSGAAAEEFHCLDQIVPTRGATTLRFLGEEREQSLLTPVSALMASSKSTGGRVKITGRPAADSEAQVLFLSSTQAVTEISSLLELIAGKAPGTPRPRWIGIPVPPDRSSPDRSSLDRSKKDRGKNARSSEIEILGSEVRRAGTLVVRDKKQKVASFGLYPLKQDPGPAPQLAAVKRKLPEPKGNLRARAAWFQGRTGGR